MECINCGDNLKRTKYKKGYIGYPSYICVNCKKRYYSGDTKSKLIIRDGVKFYNINLK